MKIYVLDASAVFIFLQKKPGAAKVNDLLKQAMDEHAQLLMSAINYAEVYGKIAREHGVVRLRPAPRDVLDLVQRHLPQALLHRLQGHVHRQHLADVVFGQQQQCGHGTLDSGQHLGP